MSLEDKVIRREVIKEMGRNTYNHLKKVPPAVSNYLKNVGYGVAEYLEASNFHSETLFQKNKKKEMPGSMFGLVLGVGLEIGIAFYVWAEAGSGNPIPIAAYFSQKVGTHGGAFAVRSYKQTRQDLEGRANTA